MQTSELLPHIPTKVPVRQEQRTLTGVATKAALSLNKAFDGEIVCTIYCEGGNKYEVLVSKTGNLLVANAQKQLGDHNALYTLKPGKEIVVAPNGEFKTNDSVDEDEDFLVTIANKTISLSKLEKKKIAVINGNPKRKNVAQSEHFIDL